MFSITILSVITTVKRSRMSSMRCNICGSVTGEHGFSFGERAVAAQRREEDRKAVDSGRGILLIPKEIVPDGLDEDAFLAEFLDAINSSLTRPCAPVVRWKEDYED